jgi:hypothetical protein
MNNFMLSLYGQQRTWKLNNAVYPFIVADEITQDVRLVTGPVTTTAGPVADTPQFNVLKSVAHIPLTLWGIGQNVLHNPTTYNPMTNLNTLLTHIHNCQANVPQNQTWTDLVQTLLDESEEFVASTITNGVYDMDVFKSFVTPEQRERYEDAFRAQVKGNMEALYATLHSWKDQLGKDVFYNIPVVLVFGGLPGVTTGAGTFRGNGVEFVDVLLLLKALKPNAPYLSLIKSGSEKPEVAVANWLNARQMADDMFWSENHKSNFYTYLGSESGYTLAYTFKEEWVNNFVSHQEKQDALKGR